MLRERTKFRYNLFTQCIRLKLTYSIYQWADTGNPLRTHQTTLRMHSKGISAYPERKKVQNVQYSYITLPVLITYYQR